jgi:hypothetical protein
MRSDRERVFSSFIRFFLSVGKIELEGKLCLEVRGKVDVLEGLVCGSDRIVDQRHNFVELFVLLFFDPA